MRMTLKLTYFDLDGGRAEAARIALSMGGLVFEDERLTFPEFNARQATFPFHTVPVLEVEGKTIAQSNAISRYVAKRVGLYPEDAFEAARCDEILDAIEDISSRVVATFAMPEAEKKATREALAAGRLGVFVDTFERMLSAAGGTYFVDERLTIADLRVFVWARYLKSDALDHIPANYLKRAPTLSAFVDDIAAHPGVAAYYAGRST